MGREQPVFGIHLSSLQSRTLCFQATVSSTPSASLPRSSPSPASSQSPTRLSIPSARRSSSPSNMRTTTPRSSSGTLCRRRRCRLTTLPSNRKWWPQTTCAWGGPVVVGHISALQVSKNCLTWCISQVPCFFPSLTVSHGHSWVFSFPS